MKKEIYYIQGYIPSDEDVAVVNIYKLVKLGGTTIKYIWICLNTGGGYGTATDFDGWSNTESDAILLLFKIGNIENRYSIEHTFEEAIEKYENIKMLLNAEIETKTKTK